MAIAELDLAVFNDGFFADYEAELAGSEAQQSITQAFQDTVLVQADSVAPKTYTQLNQEVKDFRNRSDVKLFEQSLGAAIMNSTAECAAHQHGATASDKLTADNHGFSDEHAHDENEHEHDQTKCKTCQAGKPCSKR